MNDTPNPWSDDDHADAAFRAFYAQVEQILQPPLGRAGLETGSADEAAQKAQRQLRTLIDMQDLQARHEGSRATAGLLEQQRYLKAALADELLLSRHWAGQAAWPLHLLETALFGTSVAGDKLLAEAVLLLQSREPAQRPLARLHLLTLALGFQGRLRGQDDLRTLESLRTQLYQFVYQRPPVAQAEQAVLSPQAYAHTVSHLASKRRRGFSRWTLHWGLSLAALLVVSQVLWFWQTWPLRQALTGTGAGTGAATGKVASTGQAIGSMAGVTTLRAAPGVAP